MTTNRTLPDRGKLLGDVPTATAILDRFLHHADTDDSKQLQIPTASVSVSMPAPSIITEAGPQAKKRFFEFFTANIRNKNI